MDPLLFHKVLELLEELDRRRVAYKVIGGIAMNLHGVVRATEDLDIFVQPTRDNVERLKGAMRVVWQDPEIEEIRYEDLAGDYPAVAYGPPDGSFTIDILTRLGEAYGYEDIEVEERDYGGFRIPLATPRMLYRMKRDTVPPRDRLDAEVLRELFDLGEP
ncbi:MAG: nucleotidyl transferase AbiEii/AbiGii toxin family protein [Candidatus Eremiobacterota bacterium]